MEKIIDVTFSGFWPFIGMCVLVGMLFNFILKMYSHTLRCFNLKRNGWPPKHVDADGSFKAESSDTYDAH